MKSLEEIYTEILGNPSKGDLDDLERKYREKTNNVPYKKEDEDTRLDIATIQRNGEIQNAYLYLKTQWTFKQKMDLGVVGNGVVLNSNKKNFLPKKNTELGLLDRIHLFNRNLKGITKAGIFVTFCLAAYQLTSFLILSKRENAVAAIQSLTPKLEVPLKEMKVQKSNEAPKLARIEKAIVAREVDSGLISAAKSCNLNELKSNLSGTDINSQNTLGESVGHWLCRLNCAEGLKWALENGADMSLRDHSGRTPIDWANLNNSFESIQILNRYSYSR